MGIHIFKPSNMIVVFANIIFFMVVQTLFFRYVASKQFDIVLTNKAQIVADYLQYDKDAALKYQYFKSSEQAAKIREEAEKQQKQRDDDNFNSMLKWIGIPVFIAVFIMIVFISMIFIKDNEEWDNVDTILLSFVFCAYIAEILFYLGIVNKYEFYGDQSIYSNLYQEISDNVNKEPVSEEGKKSKRYMDLMIDRLAKRSNSTDDIKRCYKEQSKNLPGISEDFFVSYATTRMRNVTDYININTFDKVSGISSEALAEIY